MASMVKIGMSAEEFWRFQDETGLTDEKIMMMTSAELVEAINKYRKQKKQ